MDQYISNSLEKVFETALGQRVNYTANTGVGIISTANTNLNGTGTIVGIITGDLYGTLIKTITIKAIGNTTRGMVRLFTYDSEGGTKRLIMEVDIPAVIQSSIDKAFSITMETDFMLEPAWNIGASTEKGESFIVIAEGVDTTFP
ncbi:MAG: hypothetical protein Q8M29_16350 [Bacteroidota bacterium]|nr:hypothetical protein [Bacteroidota bacterium]